MLTVFFLHQTAPRTTKRQTVAARQPHRGVHGESHGRGGRRGALGNGPVVTQQSTRGMIAPYMYVDISATCVCSCACAHLCRVARGVPRPFLFCRWCVLRSIFLQCFPPCVFTYICACVNKPVSCVKESIGVCPVLFQCCIRFRFSRYGCSRLCLCACCALCAWVFPSLAVHMCLLDPGLLYRRHGRCRGERVLRGGEVASPQSRRGLHGRRDLPRGQGESTRRARGRYHRERPIRYTGRTWRKDKSQHMNTGSIAFETHSV